jgi:hypothetical protein
LERFWSKTLQQEDGCIVWTGSLTSVGYGQMYVRGERRKTESDKAHRWIMQQTLGDSFLDDLMVLHHCDNRRCVNLEHLYQGSAKDNTRDMDERGRRHHVTEQPKQRGELNYQSKLTEADVREIRTMHQEGVKCPVTGEMRPPNRAALCRKYGVSNGTISAVIDGKSWKHVD